MTDYNDNHILIINWDKQICDSTQIEYFDEAENIVCSKNEILIKTKDELNSNNWSYTVLLNYDWNTTRNREIIKVLLEKENKKIVKFINFPKEMRYKLYKILGKYPLKFKKELVDNASSQVNVLGTHHNYRDEEYEISVSDSDETRTYTTDVSSDNEDKDIDFEELSNSGSESDSDSELSFEDNKNLKYIKKLININEEINKEVKKTNKLLLVLGISSLVIISTIVLMDPVRLVVESKINCK